MIGEKFKTYQVVSETTNFKDKGRKYYNLKCKCGRVYIRSTRDLNKNNIKDCPCTRYNFKENGATVEFEVRNKIVTVPNDKELLYIIEEYSWRFDKDGYVITSIREGHNMKTLTLHKVIMTHLYGESELTIDHKNRNKLDNTVRNLRYANNITQQLNRDKFKNNTSGVTGVHFDGKNDVWIARIQKNGKRLSASFNNFDDAVEQRKLWESQMM